MLSRPEQDIAVAAPPEMVGFDGGWFAMGSDDGAPPEGPRHDRHVRPFAIDRDLVTNAQFATFVAASGYRTGAERLGHSWGFDGERFRDIDGLDWRSFAGPARGDHPVVQVDWHDAAAYCTWSGKRLPNEAEWEYVARMVAGGDAFAWLSDSDLSANCGAGRRWNEAPGTSPVGHFGGVVHDLVGNVWQWCVDDYSPTAYRDHIDGFSPGGRPPAVGGLKVRRGGAWNVQQAFRLRCANRGAFMADRPAPNVGFRCAMDC